MEAPRSNNNMIFGTRAVIEAIEAGKEIDKILVRKGLQSELSRELFAALKNRGVASNVSIVPAERLDRITRKNHQGVIAYLSSITYASLENIIPMLYEQGKQPFLVLLDGVTDVRNFGAIARTALCAGVDALIIPTHGSVSVQADAVKTSAGALLTIPVCREKNITATLRYLKQCGITIIAASEKGSADYTIAISQAAGNPVCIVMGAEDTGIPIEHIALADCTASIPIAQGAPASLNVSVAAGILLYEVSKHLKK